VPITELADNLDTQKDLRILSLKGNLISDVRPLARLDTLEVLRLDNNWTR
jgi:Leucine-rich repeat (LRR) protein